MFEEGLVPRQTLDFVEFQFGDFQFDHPFLVPYVRIPGTM